MTHSYVLHESSICVTWLSHMCDMTHCDSIVSVTWLVHTRGKRLLLSLPSIYAYVCYKPFMRDMTDWCVCRPLFIRVIWLIHTRCKRLLLSLPACTDSYVWHDSFNVWHDSFICVTWLIHMCGVTHSCAWGDSCVCVTWLIHTSSKRLLLSQSWGIDAYVWHDSFICVTLLVWITRSRE